MRATVYNENLKKKIERIDDLIRKSYAIIVKKLLRKKIQKIGFGPSNVPKSTSESENHLDSRSTHLLSNINTIQVGKNDINQAITITIAFQSTYRSKVDHTRNLLNLGCCRFLIQPSCLLVSIYQQQKNS